MAISLSWQAMQINDKIAPIVAGKATVALRLTPIRFEELTTSRFEYTTIDAIVTTDDDHTESKKRTLISIRVPLALIKVRRPRFQSGEVVFTSENLARLPIEVTHAQYTAEIKCTLLASKDSLSFVSSIMTIIEGRRPPKAHKITSFLRLYSPQL